MKQDRDWTKAVQDRLRDVESPLPKGSWERLAKELPEPVLSKRLWSSRWPRYAAVAAVLLGCFAVGDAFRRAQQHAGVEIPQMMVAVNEIQPDVQLFTVPESSENSVAQARSISKKKAILRDVDAIGEISSSDHAVPKAAVAESASGHKSEQASSAQPASESPNRLARSRSIVADPFAESQIKRRGGVLFGAKAGGALTFANKGVGTRPLTMAETVFDNKGVSQMRINFAECSYAHKQPLSFAVTVGHEFPHGLSLESGVVYTLLRSEVSVPLGSGSISQHLHLIGVPVRVNWAWLNRGGFSLYMGAGGLVEKCIAARFGEEKIQEKSVQLSAFAAVGAQYRLSKHVGLYFEPEVSYYFTETTLRTSRTDRPVSFSLQLGVRFTY